MYMRMHLCMYVSVCTITCRFYTPLKIPFMFNINIQGRVRARQVYKWEAVKPNGSASCFLYINYV